MPMALLRAHVRALPALQAEEGMMVLNTNLLGSGYAKPEDVKEFASELRKAAGGKERKRKPATNAELRQIFGGGG